jgi:hypothetical protein
MRYNARDTMTARQRVERALDHSEPDRVPINDFIQNWPLVEACTGQTVTRENAVDLLCKTIADNLDLVQAVAPPMEPRTRRDLDGFVYRDEWWTTWLVERPFNDLVGLEEHIRRNIDELQEYHTGDMITFAGRADLYWGDKIKDPREHFRALQEKVEDTVIALTESPVGLDTAFSRAGFELFSYAYADMPKLISAWLQSLCDFEVKRIHDIADAALSPVALVYADIASNNGLFFSPTFLRKELLPRLRQNVDAWHTHGIKAVFHSEGNLTSFLDDLVTTGIDGIHPIEPMAGMNVGDVKCRYPHLSMVGGLDNSHMLPFSTPGEVEAAVKVALQQGKPGGGFIIGTSEVHPSCKPENVLTMWNTARTFGYYR